MNVTYVNDFCETSESDDETYEPAPKKRRGNGRSWKKVSEFTSGIEAEKAVNEKEMWKKCDSRESVEGHKTVYRCTAGKYT